MEALPLDLVMHILVMLPFRSIYSLRRVSLEMNESVTAAQRMLTEHFDVLDGIHVQNIPRLAYDTSLREIPLVCGKMNTKIFGIFSRFYEPEVFVLSSATSSPWLAKRLLRVQPAHMNKLVLVVDRLFLMILPKIEPRLMVKEVEVVAKEGITLDLALEMLNMKSQILSTLCMRGCVASMDTIFSLLPKGLESLSINASGGVHDARSITRFCELELRYLLLHDCYKDHETISNHVMRARGMPRAMSMWPFPSRALEHCLHSGVCIESDPPPHRRLGNDPEHRG